MQELLSQAHFLIELRSKLGISHLTIVETISDIFDLIISLEIWSSLWWPPIVVRVERYLGESVNIEDRFFFPGVDLEEMTSFDLKYTLIVEFLIHHIIDKEKKIRREPLATLRGKYPIIQLISHEKYLCSKIEWGIKKFKELVFTT